MLRNKNWRDCININFLVLHNKDCDIFLDRYLTNYKIIVLMALESSEISHFALIMLGIIVLVVLYAYIGNFLEHKHVRS